MTDLPPISIDPESFLHQHCTLPPLPPMVDRVQQIISRAEYDVDEVVQPISSDPALVAQILKIVNSSYYSLPRDVTEMRFAITFLGIHEVYRMLLSVSVIKTLDIKDRDALYNFWFHSFYTALCTKYLAKKFEPHLSFEELWSAAILHDIGKLIYLKFFPDHYRALLDFCREQGCLFSTAENHLSFPSSAELGALLCKHWRLPAKIKIACEAHRFSDLSKIAPDSPNRSFCRIICMGNLMTILCTEQLNEEVKHELADEIQKTFTCSESEFLALMGDIYDLRIETERFVKMLV